MRLLQLIKSPFGKIVVLAASIAMVAAPWPRARASVSSAPRGDATRRAMPVAPTPSFLRDAVPSAGFTVAPEDSTDELFLPEEQDTEKLVWEIAAWVVGAALVAFFIIKVFIEEDPPERETGGGGKPSPF